MKKKIVIPVLIIVLLIGAVAAIAYFFDLNRFKPLISQAVKYYTGRELTINGDIRLLGYWPPTIAADDVAWQNAPWGSKPHMISVKRAACAVSLKSLLRGEFRFFNIRLQEPEVLLEFNRQGVSNFLLDIPETKGKGVVPVLAFRNIFIQNGYFEYSDQRWNLNASINVNDLEADIPGLDKPIQILFTGRFRDLPCSLEGSIGPIMAWIQPDNILPVNLSASLGKASARLEGDIQDPIHLKDISLAFKADGPSTREMAGMVGRESDPELGSFAVKAELTDRSGLLAIENLTVNVGSPKQVSLSGSGSISNLIEMKGFDLNLSLQTHHIGNLMLLADLPPPPFEDPFSASVTFSDTAQNQYSLENFSVNVGDKTIQGRMDLDLTSVRPVLDMQLHSEHDKLGSFALKTRMSGSLERVSVEHLDLQMAHENLYKAFIVGTVGSLSPIEDLNLNFNVLGNDLARLQQLTDKTLPLQGPYAMTGAVFMADHQAIQVPELKIILNNNSINGSLGLELGHDQPVLHGELASNRINLEQLLTPGTLPENIQANLSAVGPSRLSFQLSGPIERPALNSMEMQTRVENLATLHLKGTIKDLLAMTGTDLDISVKGETLENLSQLVGDAIPFEGPYSISGKLRNPSKNAYLFDNLEVTTVRNRFKGRSELTFADLKIIAAIHMGTDNVSLEALAKGKSAALDRLRIKEDLGPLEVQATAILSQERHHLQALDLLFGKEDFVRMRVKGSIDDLPELEGVQLNFNVSGRNVADLESIAGQAIPIKGPYELSGELSGHASDKLMFRKLDLTLEHNHFAGWADLSLVDSIPEIEAEVTADHVSLFPVTLEEVEPLKKIPDLGPFRLAFRLEEKNHSPALTHMDFHLGRKSTIFTKLSGTVGNLAPIGDVTLDFEVHSNDISILRNAYDSQYLLAKPLHAKGRLHDPSLEKFTLTAFQASYGDSDLSGTADLDLAGDRPALTAHMSSRRLDLRPVIQTYLQDDTPSTSSHPPPPANQARKRLFSSKPFNFEPLQQADVHIIFQADEILFRNVAFDDVDIQMRLRNGDLYLNPLKLGAGGGTAEGALTLKTSGTRPYMATRFAVHHLDTGPMLEQLGQESTIQGTLNATVYLNGSGNSVAALMAGINGRIYLDIHDGRIESKQLALLERYMGSNVLDLINPFIKRPPHTTIHCLISTTDIKDGQTVYRMVLDTEQTALASDGTIDLKTEEIDIGIKPTPKRGFGDSQVGHVSFSLKELSQPFALGGTLLKPRLVLDPGRTIVTAAKFAGATLFGPVGITWFFTDISLGKKNICEEATKSMRKK